MSSGIENQDNIGPLIGDVKITVRKNVAANESGPASEKDYVEKDYLLPPVTFRDWATTQNLLMDDWRKRRVSLVTSMRNLVPPEEYVEMRAESFRDATNLTMFNPDQLREIMGTDVGVGTLIWVLAERKYRGELTRDECQEVVATNRVSPEAMDLLTVQINQLMGVTGNSTGQVSA